MTEPTSRRRLVFPDLSGDESTYLGDLFRREAVGGTLALVAAAVAVVWANSPWAASYEELRHLAIGPLDVEHWAADGALTLFFFVAGLELKRELVVGSLRRVSDAAVPVVAAVCGVAVPAAIYFLLNTGPAGEPGRLGDPGGHGHRLRPGGARRGGVQPADRAAGLPAHARGRGRPHRHHHHRGVLHRGAVPGLARARRGGARAVRGRPALPGPLAPPPGPAGPRRVVVHARERHPRHHRRRRPRPAGAGPP